MEKIIAQILREKLQYALLKLTLVKLHGDASYRTYYRADLGNGKTCIVMKIPEGLSSVSEEVTNLRVNLKELPFLNIGQFLKRRGLPVPEILFYDKKAGLLILEDLGDETLEKKIKSLPEPEREGWYRKAIDLLVVFQGRTASEEKDCIAYQRSFDETLFNWEFDHFVEYGIEARLGEKMPESDLHSLRTGTREVTRQLVKMPRIFTHRDYQSRNLMIQGKDLKILDFQDALMGPLPYDLVALLRDSYVVLGSEMVTRLMRYYLEVRHRETGETLTEDSFQKMFDRVTIQRKLKDAGRFVFIDRVKKNPSFLPFVPTSLGYVREALERQSDLKNLYHILKKYTPEFQ